MKRSTLLLNGKLLVLIFLDDDVAPTIMPLQTPIQKLIVLHLSYNVLTNDTFKRQPSET
jgi:hypothetical protein